MPVTGDMVYKIGLHNCSTPGRMYGMLTCIAGDVKWTNGVVASGHSLCAPAHPKSAGLHRDRRPHTGAGDRSKHDAILGCEGRVAEPAAVFTFRAACSYFFQYARRRPWACCLSEFPRLATAKSHLRINGDLPQPGLQPH